MRFHTFVFFFTLLTSISNAQQVYPIPEKLSFAGETVPLKDPDVRERLERELAVNCHRHAGTIMILKRCGRWEKKLKNILKQNKVPEDFFYLATAESDLLNVTSPAGASGFWQFMKGTATQYELEVTDHIDERLDPEKAAGAACTYFTKAKDQLGSWTLAAAGFNRGTTGIANALKEQKVKSYYDLYLNEETYRYVFRILALKLIIEKPEAYGFKLKKEDYWQPFQTKELEITETIEHLPDYAIKNGTTYKVLKRLNPWLKNTDYKLEVPEGSKYRILLPVTK